MFYVVMYMSFGVLIMLCLELCVFFFFFQAEDGIRDAQESRGLGDVYKRQVSTQSTGESLMATMIRILLLAPLVAGSVMDVVHLDSNNFEHDTQAATGATTGDWLVKFYAPGCNECEQMAEEWGSLAVALKDRLTVAEVDCAESPDLCSRFSVKSYPDLKLFRRGKVYELGGIRGIAGWTEFIEDGYKKTPSAPRRVPKPPTAMDVYLKAFGALALPVKIGALVGVCVLLGIFLMCMEGQGPKTLPREKQD
eukprot:TRINITY_DN15127_c0_g1_i2.p1 TRINITY_DN15127_c0_g1~~TRINITY_DN15127_c0_g1_i2.p1  ORF type:complete len:251 (+),score=62.10 TRINITY_DN15127_c0_g1_i2:33-785(+)